MKAKGMILVMYDSPDDPDFVAWVHGPHYDEVYRTPGVTKIHRYLIMAGPPDKRQFAAIIESDDVDATLKWRDSQEGQRSQQEADARGLRNRYGLVGKLIYSSEDKPR